MRQSVVSLGALVVLGGHFWPDSSRIGRIVLFSSRIDCSDSRIVCDRMGYCLQMEAERVAHHMA